MFSAGCGKNVLSSILIDALQATAVSASDARPQNTSGHAKISSEDYSRRHRFEEVLETNSYTQWLPRHRGTRAPELWQKGSLQGICYIFWESTTRSHCLQYLSGRLPPSPPRSRRGDLHQPQIDLDSPETYSCCLSSHGVLQAAANNYAVSEQSPPNDGNGYWMDATGVHGDHIRSSYGLRIPGAKELNEKYPAMELSGSEASISSSEDDIRVFGRHGDINSGNILRFTEDTANEHRLLVITNFGLPTLDIKYLREAVAAPSSHTQELLSAQWDLSRDWQSSHSPLRTARPTQRQSIEGNAEYSLGAPRNNRGKLSRFSQPTSC
jgi:hypothetical protein